MARNGIRTNQKRAIAALLTAESIEAAAGVGERTIYRWLAEDVDFRDALRQAQNQALDSAVSRLTGAAMTAANFLVSIPVKKVVLQPKQAQIRIISNRLFRISRGQ